MRGRSNSVMTLNQIPPPAIGCAGFDGLKTDGSSVIAWPRIGGERYSPPHRHPTASRR